MRLDCGVELGPYRVAYQTYGELNADKSNAVLICHALTGDQFVAEQPSGDRQARAGGRAWSAPARCSIPARYFIICVNVLGGCMGTTGPRAQRSGDRPAVGPRASRSSPSATWCAPRRRCSITWASTDLFCVIGGSMGGMQVLEWAASYPSARVLRRADRLRRAPFGAEHRVPRGRPPGDHGRSGMEGRRLSPARHATRRAGWRSRAWPRTSPIFRSRRCSASSAAACRTAMRWASASTPTSRSRAICATRARPSSTASTPTATSTSPAPWTISTWPASMAACWPTPSSGTPTRFCLMSFTTDWLFPTRESREIVHALNAAAANV